MKTRIILCILLFSFILNGKHTEPNHYFSGNVHIYSKSTNQKLANKLAAQLHSDIIQFQKQIGSYDNKPVKIIMAESADEYRKWTQRSSAIIEFSQAFYNNQNKLIYLRDPGELRTLLRIRKILLHEYIHHFINNHIKDPPLWFHEGMAIYFSHDMSINREFNFAKNYILGNSVPLELMKYSYPKNRIEWESFYAKSGLAIKYLFTQRKNSFYQFWDEVKKEGNFNSAFIKSFYFTPKDFSALFEEYAKSHFRAEIFMASSSLIWGFMPLILIIAVIRKKIKTKKKELEVEKMEIEENAKENILVNETNKNSESLNH